LHTHLIQFPHLIAHISDPKVYRFIFIFVLLLSFGGFVVWAQRPELPVQQPNQEIRPIAPSAAKQISRANRIREGTAFKGKHVFFRETGDQIVLYTVEDSQRFACLKNLALERILATMQEKPERQFWKIDGEFTEFRGENFVLISRAVVAQPPASNIPAAP